MFILLVYDRDLWKYLILKYIILCRREKVKLFFKIIMFLLYKIYYNLYWINCFVGFF